MNGAMRIVNFHGIGAAQRVLERGEARYWLDEGRFRDMLDRIAAHAERGLLRLTFDDGNISDLAIAAPEVKGRGMRATFFVLAGRIGQPGSLSGADIRELLAMGMEIGNHGSGADIRELLAMGMEIGNHGFDHVDWTSLSPRRLEQQLRCSRAAIEDVAGAAVRVAAMPFGRYNAAVIRALSAAGYAEVYSSDGGSAAPAAFVKPRKTVVADMSDMEVDAMLAGRLPWPRRARRWVSMTVKHAL